MLVLGSTEPAAEFVLWEKKITEEIKHIESTISFPLIWQ